MEAIEEEENSPTRNIFVFGFEAIIALTLGMFFLCCNTIILWKTKIIEKIIEKCVDKLPILKLFGFGKPPAENQEEQAAPRIGSDSCCICFGDITREVSSTCGHIFCGKCLIEFWESKNKNKLQCPLCRRDINMIIINFSTSDVPPNDLETKKVIRDIKFYNKCFSKHPRTIYQVLQDSPYLMRRLIFSLSTREGFTFFLKRVLGSLYILALVVYILSPLDLIPDYIMILGWIDDAVAVIYLILYVTILYYNFLRERN